MELREYFKNNFKSDFFKMLNTEKRKSVEGFCFGGQNWENYEKNIRPIAAEYKKLFIKSLFLSQLVQACVHCYYPDFYNKYYCNMPFFGNYGFGPHHVKIRQIINIPAEHGIIFDEKEFTEMAQDFFDQCLVDCERFGINYTEFLSKIYNDRELRNARKDNLDLFSKFVAEFDRIYQEAVCK